MIAFTNSTDYATIQALLREPKCARRMNSVSYEVGPREGLEYILAEENGKPVAVFVIVEGIELHFCFSPEAWGRTLEISQEFLNWLWRHTKSPVVIGPVPKRNRLALSLALRAGFQKSHLDGEIAYLYLERPAA